MANAETTAAKLRGNWHYPTEVLFGAGRLAELADAAKQMGMQKPLFVTDVGLANLDFVKNALAGLSSGGVEAALFSAVQPNPTGQNVVDGVNAYHQGRHDGVITLGGGSALDVGKAVALMVGQSLPLWAFEDVGDNWQQVNTQGMAPVIAIPSTAGTGSEVGRSSVIIHEEQCLKKIIFHPKMLPALVIADPEITLGLSAHITAATGVDAFVHNLEAFCAPGYHPMAEGIAVEGMRLIKDNLPLAFHQGNNLIARSHLMVASSMGATAFQKGLGGVHALAHPLGALYNAHHGLLNAIILPYVLQRNMPMIASKLTYLARVLELEQQTADGFMAWLLAFLRELQIPQDLKSIGIDEAQAVRVGQMAVQDAAAGGNPIALTAEDYEALFLTAVRGTL